MLSGAAASAQYQYYYTDTLTSINSANWTTNGSVSTSSAGLTSSSSGSLISKITAPGNPAAYEVKMTLALTTNGGNFFSYLRSTTNGLSGSSGDFYGAQIASPTFSGTNCSAMLYVLKSVSGSVNAVYATTVPCGATTVVRSVYTPGGSLAVYIGDVLYVVYQDTAILGGQPGVGASWAPAGNTVSKVEFGQIDTTAPPAMATSAFGTTAFPNRFDMQWQGASDNLNGTGIAYYRYYRDSDFVTEVRAPEISDQTILAGETHTVGVSACDFHLNCSPITTQTTTDPPAGAVDPRQVGVRATGAYYGSGGEQIDLRSGNLAFAVPLLKAMGRGGWSVPFGLVYNSQNWRQDPGGTWKLGHDSGYGWGWKLLAGSLTPYYQDYWTIHHYILTDASGAEYRLDHVDANGVWYSSENAYVWYRPSDKKLFFKDGSFWVMGCTSNGVEEDAGTLYPTTMEDTNGNLVTVLYYTGIGLTWPNSSGVVSQISDVRNQLGPAYNFTYDGIHLLSISNTVNTAESYTFGYTSKPLTSPFSVSALGAATLLDHVTTNGINLTTQFTYDSLSGGTSSGELMKVTMPYGGYLRWLYGTATFNSMSVRTVQGRYWSADGGVTEKQYTIGRDPGDSSRALPLYAELTDVNGSAKKKWTFDTNGFGSTVGLLTQFSEYDGTGTGATERIRKTLTWSQNGGGFYVSQLVTTVEPGASQKQKTTTQEVDVYGNMRWQKVYDWGLSSGTPLREYRTYYLHSDPNYPWNLNTATYDGKYIRNRVTRSTLTDGTNTVTLVSNYYDGGGITDVPTMQGHDSAYGTGFIYRGNVTLQTMPGKSVTMSYDIGGNPGQTQVNGVTTNASFQSGTNYAAPSSITTGSLTETFAYSPFLAPTGVTGPNGDSNSMTYDSYGRPQTATAPAGAVTSYAYSGSAPWTSTATTNGRWTRTTMDGFGRTVKTEVGTGGTTVSVVDAVYDACGCSPLGKLKQTSMPHAPGAGAVWTVNSYDGMGRTTRVTMADGSHKDYVYFADTVLATDEAGKCKRLTNRLPSGFGVAQQ